MEQEFEEIPNNGSSGVPVLALVGYVLGTLEILGGVILCEKLWPGEPEPGYRWLFTAYLPALTWLMAGIISGFFFFVVSAILTHLHHIRRTLEDFTFLQRIRKEKS